MTLLSKPLSEYIAFTKWLTILILVAGITRLALSLGGVPNSTTRWIAMSGLMFFGTIYLAVRVHTAGFGSYKQLFPAILVPNATLHLVSILGIAIGIITGQDNVFTAPEYALGGDGKTLIHAGAHLVIGIPFSTLVNWIVGCLFLFIARKLVRRNA